jgi:hypothetical protein
MSVITNPYVKSKQKAPAQSARPCLGCGVMFVAKRGGLYHTDQCRKNHWFKTHPPRLISAAQVRREDHLDRPKTAHVCHWYAPAYRCTCGKRQAAALTANTGG